MNTKWNKILWGVVIAGFGAMLGLRALGLINFNVLFRGWWTLFIIVPCTIGLITEKRKWGSLIGLLIGVALLLACQDVLNFQIVWRLILPVMLVGWGIAMVVRGATDSDVAHRKACEQEHRRRNKLQEGEVVEESKEYWATFSGQRLDYAGKKFEGCRLEAVFGGIELDLRGAEIVDGAIVKVSSIFGGTKIVLPANLKVEVSSAAIFGGVTNDYAKKAENRETEACEKVEADEQTKANKKQNAMKTLYVDATCVFGGVEIK